MEYKCESCQYYGIDMNTGISYCDADVDEDDYYRLASRKTRECPYYNYYDEYKIARRQ